MQIFDTSALSNADGQKGGLRHPDHTSIKKSNKIFDEHSE